MQSHSIAGHTIALTTSPRLDAALVAGFIPWEAAARAAGANAVAAWLAQRQGAPDAAVPLVPVIEALFGAADAEDRALARAELAELIGDADVLAADTLWDGVLAAGRELDEAETIFDAIRHLAAIAEAHGDPLAAGEYFLVFLNWRREVSHASEPELVESAFDEVIRLARADGAQREAALFEFRQATFVRLVERDDPRTAEGDWEPAGEPYPSWA